MLENISAFWYRLMSTRCQLLAFSLMLNTQAGDFWRNLVKKIKTKKNKLQFMIKADNKGKVKVDPMVKIEKPGDICIYKNVRKKEGVNLRNRYA